MRRRTVGAALALVTSVLVACTIPTGATVTPTPTDAAGYRAIWDAKHPASYTYTIRRDCFCFLLGPLAVTVVDGEVASIATQDGKRLQPNDPRLRAYPLSIDDLFGYASRAEVESDRSDIGYDPTFGYPQIVDVDWDSTTPDDDVTITVSDFRPTT